MYKINEALFEKMVSCLKQADGTLFYLEGEINPSNEDLIEETHLLMDDIIDVLNEIHALKLESE